MAVSDAPVQVAVEPFSANWLMFPRTTDLPDLPTLPSGSNSLPSLEPVKALGMMGKPMADYVIIYHDGTDVRKGLRHYYEIAPVAVDWGALLRGGALCPYGSETSQPRTAGSGVWRKPYAR